MNKTIKKRLRLNKITVQGFENQLDGVEQKKINGGSVDSQVLTTVTPVFCPPNPNG